MHQVCKLKFRTFENEKVFKPQKSDTRRIAVPGCLSRFYQRVWRINRMSIVSQNRAVGQFRCRVIAGVRVYEQIIPVTGGPNNYQPTTRLVVESAWKNFYSRPAQSRVS